MNPDCGKPVLLCGVLGGFMVGALDFLRTSNLRRGIRVGSASTLLIAVTTNVICHHIKFKDKLRTRMSYFDFKRQLDEELAKKHISQ